MPFQSLYSTIFGEKHRNTDEGSMLGELTGRYPYFSLAHFFLLKNTAETGEAYNQVAAKTALHFNNAFLLHEQLHQLPVEENLFEPVSATEQTILDGYEPGSPQVVQAHPPHEDVAPVGTASINEVILQEENGLDIAPCTQEPAVMVDLPANNTPVAEEVTIDTEKVEIPAEPVRESLLPQQVVLGNIPPEESDTFTTAAAPTFIAPQEAATRQEIEVPLFEPLSASDYFASQGIKLSEEQQPSDRMGKQLKSFTEWLKTMKKVHDNKLAGVEGTVDLTVQNLAEKSNKEEEILTEAMAEVFLQQGKSNKAKEIYEKLSLLNPAKSAYFAAKLEQIK